MDSVDFWVLELQRIADITGGQLEQVGLTLADRDIQLRHAVESMMGLRGVYASVDLLLMGASPLGRSHD